MGKLLRLLLLCISSWIYSQISNGANEESNFSYTILSNIKSPQTSEFTRYGNIPINKFVGEPSLDIPLINVRTSQLGDNISMSLGYNFSGFMPNKRPDIVGLDWHLNVGGVITREIKSIADDQKGSSATSGGLFGQSKDGLIVGLRSKQNCLPLHTNVGIFNLSSSTGSFTGDLDYKMKGCDISTAYDGDADIFSFNFNGTSGKFFVDNDNQIRILSDNAKGFKIDISNVSTQPITNQCKPLNSEIKITDSRGNIYYFGGESKNLEYNVNLSRDQQNRESKSGLPVITAWYLRKIEYSNGEEVNYNYRDDSILSDSFCFGNTDISDWHGTNNTVQLRKQFILYNKLYLQDMRCNLIMPDPCVGSEKAYSITKRVILDNITGTNFNVNIKQSLQPYTFNYETTDLSFFQRIQNTKVDSITLYSGIKKINQYVFNYELSGGTSSQGSFPRLFLKSIKEDGKNPYIFNYDIPSSTLFPKAVTMQIDYWGFYNGKTGNENLQYLIPQEQYDAAGDYYYTSAIREPDFNFSKLGLLKEVVYPTKGLTRFEFEEHNYNYRIERKKNNNYLPQALTFSGIAGGARIKSISQEIDGSIVQKKEYLYADGILNQWPRYTMRLNIPAGDFAPPQTILYWRSSSLLPNIQESSMINYGKVTELQSNKGKIESYFSNYLTNPDINDTNVLININNSLRLADDVELAKNYIGIYLNDVSEERGKIKQEKVYDNQNFLLRNDIYTYNENSNRYNEYSAEIHLSGPAVQANKRYYYQTNLSKKESHEYFLENGLTKEIMQTENFVYSSAPDYQLTDKQTISPDGVVDQEQTIYAYQNSNALMISKNIISVPIEKIILRKENINANGKMIHHSKDIYPTSLPTPQTGNIVLPTSVLSYDLQNPTSTTTEMLYDKYDFKGNLQQYTTKDGIPTAIVWGYNSTQPIAKVQGATYDQLVSLGLVTAIVNASDQDASNSANEPALITALDTFRKNSGLSTYQVSTYTYDPLIGVTSITPPSGIREVYIYDTANRLKEIRQQEKDTSGNMVYKVVKEFKYNYKN
ncbi:hypothetical protein [Chryseobacterium paridis]|uniref:YD repeat-containing protein n=1 Tax=Chryseobacterium paridis TaxID=2800328 RepID=A0ABS1FQD0_9FLAO|nr:hypothetical protein [Chryseobacterium paridis]MBK1894599.1 hypothetical protein [Chryseobacterium paridis]